MWLQSWVRKSHGTGTGFTTQQGFWIPIKPTAEELARAEAAWEACKAAQPPEQGHAAAKARRTAFQPHDRQPAVRPSTAVDAGMRQALLLAQQGAGDDPSSHTEAGSAGQVCDPAVLQAVQLLPLPAGVPEEVPVICNGRSGLLNLRTQRVLHNGAELSASRFEALCGKGDAKKWKCSVHLEVAPGVSGEVRHPPLGHASAVHGVCPGAALSAAPGWRTPEGGLPGRGSCRGSRPGLAWPPVSHAGAQVLNDWLNGQHLDRKALGNLAANQAAFEAYLEHVDEEVAALVEGMIQVRLWRTGGAAASAAAAAEQAASTALQAPCTSCNACWRSGWLMHQVCPPAWTVMQD